MTDETDDDGSSSSRSELARAFILHHIEVYSCETETMAIEG
jgi:hypothetical protein